MAVLLYQISEACILMANNNKCNELFQLYFYFKSDHFLKIKLNFY